MIKLKAVLLSLRASLQFFSTVFAQAPVPAVGSDRTVDWSSVGVQASAPTAAHNIFDVMLESGTIPEKVASAISKAKNAPGVSIVYFPAGSYDLNAPIELTNVDGKDIILQGAGSTSTFVRFTMGNSNSHCFHIHGVTSGEPSTSMSS